MGQDIGVFEEVPHDKGLPRPLDAAGVENPIAESARRIAIGPASRYLSWRDAFGDSLLGSTSS